MPEIRVGNVPHSVVISPDGTTAYVSNEAGRIATANDFQGYSNGTPVVAAYPTGSTATGTVSVVNLSTFTVTGSISTGLHPTGMAFWGNYLLVANTYSDTISVIDTTTNTGGATINLGLPIGVPGDRPAGLRRRAELDRRRCREQHRLRRALQCQRDRGGRPRHVIGLPRSCRLGMIPVGYAPSSVVLDAADNVLLVANDKGIGTTGFGVAPPPTNTAENSYATDYGVTDFNTHQDLGTVSIVPVPNPADLGGDDAAGLPEQPLGSVRKISTRPQAATRMPRRSQSRRRSAIRRRSSTSS